MENKKKYISAKRADKLTNELIGYLSELQKMPDLLFTLLNCGFTYDELITYYSFEPADIAETMEGVYTYSIDGNKVMRIFEIGYLMATIQDVDRDNAQQVFEDVIYQLRGFDLKEVYALSESKNSISASTTEK